MKEVVKVILILKSVGVLTTADGDKYEGEWKRDKKNGTGILS